MEDIWFVYILWLPEGVRWTWYVKISCHPSHAKHPRCNRNGVEENVQFYQSCVQE